MILVKELLVIAIFYYWFVCVCLGDEIKVKQCRRSRDLGKKKAKSIVHEVRIEPCLGGGVCEIYKGSNATLSLKFTPSEIPSPSLAYNLKSKLTWVSKIDMDFGDISSDACDYMNCPFVLNEENEFKATFFVSKMWPTGSYPLRLRVQEKGGKRMFFCQVFKVKVTDKPTDIMLN